ncbi:sugar phosphate isomerase/epimerase family protein [Lacticaseibacillus jixiensis]|uniref:sugar phosphate isomerase/epimerase family protein n=1 Tax=Lacticaseibacillus jixiensis TaxID=3231926 RepID=UPI0036F1A936
MIWGVQQFQLRQEFNSLHQAQTTLQAVRDAGFGGIELNDFMLHRMSLGVRMLCRLAGMPLGGGGKFDWPKLIEAAKLPVIALHVDLNGLLKDPSGYLATAKKLQTRNLVITGMRQFDYRDDAAVAQLASRLNQAGQLVQAQGLQLLYHNHNTEFQRLHDGRISYDALIEATEPKLVGFEFDAFWAADAGVDVQAVMAHLGPRQHLMHLTDRVPFSKGRSGPILKSRSTELGDGVMPLPALIQQAKRNQVQAIVLESTSHWCNNSGLLSMQRSAAFIQHEQLGGDGDE